MTTIRPAGVRPPPVTTSLEQFGMAASCAEEIIQKLEDQQAVQQGIRRDAQKLQRESDGERVAHLRRNADLTLASAIVSGVGSIAASAITFAKAGITAEVRQHNEEADAMRQQATRLETDDGTRSAPVLAEDRQYAAAYRDAAAAKTDTRLDGMDALARGTEAIGKSTAGILDSEGKRASADAEESKSRSDQYRQVAQDAQESAGRLSKMSDRAMQQRDEAIISEGQRRNQRA